MLFRSPILPSNPNAPKQDGFGSTVAHRGLGRELQTHRTTVQSKLHHVWYDKHFNNKMSCLCALNDCIIELSPLYDEAVAKFLTLHEARQLIMKARGSEIPEWPTMHRFVQQILKRSGINERGTEWTDYTGRVAYDSDKLWAYVLDEMTRQQTDLGFKQYYTNELQYLRCHTGDMLHKHFETFTSHMLKGDINDEDLEPSAEAVFLKTLPVALHADIRRVYAANEQSHKQVGTWDRETPLQHMYAAALDVMDAPEPTTMRFSQRRNRGQIGRAHV